MKVGGEHDASGLGWMWRQCLLREPSPKEAARLLRLLNDERQRGADDDHAWSIVAGVILCLDEFVTKR